MKEDEFLKFYLEQEVNELNIKTAEDAKTLLALIGLERLKIFKDQKFTKNDLKKLAADLIR